MLAGGEGRRSGPERGTGIAIERVNPDLRGALARFIRSLHLETEGCLKTRCRTWTQLPGGVELVSIITKHSAEELEIAAGREVYAVIKATDIIVGSD